MYISRLSAKTQGLRKAFINAQENDRHYNIKSLRSIDKGLARKYTDAKYYGGSLKSFWEGAKKFGKRILNSAVETTKNMYKGPKMLIDAISKSDTAKNVISKVGNAVGSSFGVPTLGTMINTGISSASSITDMIENIIKNIKNKNPQLAVNDIKNVINKVKDTTEEITKQTNLKDEEKQKVLDNVKKIYDKLPDVIKSEGLNKVDKAAGYLPFVDVNTLKAVEKKTKSKTGGMINKQAWKITKPVIIRHYKTIFDKLPKYEPQVVADVAAGVYGALSSQPVPGGRLTLSGSEGGASKPSDMKIVNEPVKVDGCGAGRLRMAGGEESELMKKLKAKLGK